MLFARDSAVAGFIVFAAIGADLVAAVIVGSVTLAAAAEAYLGASRGLVVANAVKDVSKGYAISLKGGSFSS